MSHDSARRDGWSINRHDVSGVEETLFALADGVLGVRAGLEERRSSTSGAYLASVYETTPIRYHERLPGFAESTDTRVPVADGMRVRIEAGSETLGGTETQLEACDWNLDLRRGAVTRTSIWSTSHGRLEIRSERVMPALGGASVALRYTVRSLDFSGALTITSLLDTTNRNAPEGDDPRIGANLEGGGLRLARAAVLAGITYCVQQTLRSGIWVAAAQAHRVERGLHHVTERAPGEGGVSPDASPAERFAASLQSGDVIVLQKVVAYATGLNSPAPPELEQLCARASSLSQETFDSHLRARADGVDSQWQISDIRIGGDDTSDRALRFNIFHLLQSAGRDPRFGTAAKGLTGEGYEGHLFWDSEAFLVPALVFSAPHLARSALEARIHQLDGARATARALNHRQGALYPWRTIAGRECSAHYPSGSAQYHINAAIAQAIELYVTATGDDALLLNGGAEVLWETARVWIDVGTFSRPHGGKFCIFGVTGPDEYSALVDNNYYTNRMAGLHLKYAADTYETLSRAHPAIWGEMTAQLGLHDDEVAAWRAASEAMFLPYDATLQIDAQDESFLAKPRLNWHSPDAIPLLLSCHPLTLYRHQVSKQADLILAMAFAGDDVPRERLQRNLEYYEEVTTHDSTLSACAHAIVAARAAMLDKALEYFRKTTLVDIEDVHGNVIHGSHMASMAGSVMAVYWGFAGMSWRGGMLGFRPALPKPWTSLAFRMLWRGRLLELEMTQRRTVCRLLRGEPLELRHFDTSFWLTASTPREWPVTSGNHDVKTGRREFQGVLFDLDGVIVDTATLHYAAWKRLADQLALPFDADANHALKGVDRLGSLDLLLGPHAKRFSADEKHRLADLKNDWYVRSLEAISERDLLLGAREALVDVHRAGLKTALVSASRNAVTLIKRLGIAHLFDAIVDPSGIAKGKPAPDIFLAAARELGVEPAHCLGVEDAPAGVAGLKAAGMAAIGVGDPHVLRGADWVIPDLSAFHLASFGSVA